MYFKPHHIMKRLFVVLFLLYDLYLEWLVRQPISGLVWLKLRLGIVNKFRETLTWCVKSEQCVGRWSFWHFIKFGNLKFQLVSDISVK